MAISKKPNVSEIDELKAQISLLEDQLLTAQSMLEQEAQARIAIEERLKDALASKGL